MKSKGRSKKQPRRPKGQTSRKSGGTPPVPSPGRPDFFRRIRKTLIICIILFLVFLCVYWITHPELGIVLAPMTSIAGVLLALLSFETMRKEILEPLSTHYPQIERSLRYASKVSFKPQLWLAPMQTAINILTQTIFLPVLALTSPLLSGPINPPSCASMLVANTTTPLPESIGISIGASPFDTTRLDGSLKIQAANKLKLCDTQGAESLWQQAISKDPSDAEAHIYYEDQQILDYRRPYITVVVLSILTGKYNYAGRGNLQGIFLAQDEYNKDALTHPNRVLVRILIANISSDVENDTQVAKLIVDAKQRDRTIIGLVGWPFSSISQDAIRILTAASIPMVSLAASTDLYEPSPYLFNISPSIDKEARAAAWYVKEILRKNNIVLFLDNNNIYSRTLAEKFTKYFTADKGIIICTEPYQVGASPAILQSRLQDALSLHPNMLYFAGYPTDVSALLSKIAVLDPVGNVPIMGGDAFYETGGYSKDARAGFSHLLMTSFSYADESSILSSMEKPSFIEDYPRTFDPHNAHIQYPYGSHRPDSDAILAYDAMKVMMRAVQDASNENGTRAGITSQEVEYSLRNITGRQSVTGISGQIAFGPDNAPLNKPIVLLKVNKDNYIQQIQLLSGCYIKGNCGPLESLTSTARGMKRTVLIEQQEQRRYMLLTFRSE